MLYFGLGLQLVVSGTRHRVWFIPLQSAAGETTGTPAGEQTIVAGSKVDLNQLGPARSTNPDVALTRARA
jgi:hypothetical protein